MELRRRVGVVMIGRGCSLVGGVVGGLLLRLYVEDWSVLYPVLGETKYPKRGDVYFPTPLKDHSSAMEAGILSRCTLANAAAEMLCNQHIPFS